MFGVNGKAPFGSQGGGFMAVSFREDGIVFAHNDWGKGVRVR